MTTILNIDNQKEFEKALNSEGKVIVDFYAEWCGPCKLLKIQLEQILEEKGDEIKIVKVDVDKNPDIASKYGLMSVPTMIFIDKGKVFDKVSGFRPKEVIIDVFER